MSKKSELSLSEIAKLHTELAGMPDDLQLGADRASEALNVMGIRMAAQTLAKIRCVSSRGPAFRKVANGRVVYRLGDLREFAGFNAGGAK